MKTENSKQPQLWHEQIMRNGGERLASVPDYLTMSDNADFLPFYSYPVKLDESLAVIVVEGNVEFSIGLKRYVAVAPCLVSVVCGSIVQCHQRSDDFKCRFIALQPMLSNDMYRMIDQRMQLMLTTHSLPVIPFDRYELETNLLHYDMLLRCIKGRPGQNMKKIVCHLLLAMYYMQHSAEGRADDGARPSPAGNEVCQKFMALLEENYMRERQVAFYADKLCLTPKYLSKVVKAHTGKSVNEWIDASVMLEARALLRSSTQSIQRICERLHFDDLSNFGKYFKAREGVSPQRYRQAIGEKGNS